MTYKELLLDMQWDQKRSAIKDRDSWCCTFCSNELLKLKELFPNNNNLQVHHLKYIEGRKPWEYDNNDLVTLCEICHAMCYKNNFITNWILEDRLKPGGYFVYDNRTIDDITNSADNLISDEPIEWSMTNEVQLNKMEIRLLRYDYSDEPNEVKAIIDIIRKFINRNEIQYVVDGELCDMASAIAKLGLGKFIDPLGTTLKKQHEKLEIRNKAIIMFNRWKQLKLKLLHESN